MLLKLGMAHIEKSDSAKTTKICLTMSFRQIFCKTNIAPLKFDKKWTKYRNAFLIKTCTIPIKFVKSL